MAQHTLEKPNSEGVRRRGEPQGRDVRGGRQRSRQTPLDRLVIDAVVDSKKGVVGALTERDVVSAVDELISLNERRQQSYFHAGFRDALLDRPVDADKLAETERRARWYWAGALTGFARSDSWDSIVEAFDSADTVRTLGEGIGQASRMAGELVARGLWKAGRASDMHRFVSMNLAKKPEVFRLLIEAGTESLRSQAPGVARNLFDLLLRTGESQKLEDSLAEAMPMVRRRMAHCLRLLGEHQGAVDLLERLLDEEGDLGVQSMVHADLGLLQGRFALLDEVRIPGDPAERRDLVDRLRLGEKHFREAVADPDAAYASHGHYCLGVLSLADDGLDEERFAVADAHLEKAHAGISGNRHYPESLLAQIALYSGVAKSQLLDAAEIRHAARLIVSGLKCADMPRHFVAPVIASLACSEKSIEMVAQPLLESGGDEGLDALADTGILETYPPIAERLHSRAGMPNRRRSQALTDLRRALRGYLGRGKVEAACEVLNELEQHAFEGSGVTEFLEILSDRDRYAQAWEPEDAALASARCLEAKGEFAESLAILRPVFFKFASAGELLNALGVLEQIETYGLDPSEYVDLKQRYERLSQDDEVVELGSSAADRVRVLLVGGNEIQARSEGGIEAKLARRDPHVTVEFLRTGWGSNWNDYLGKIKTEVARCDGVVVMRFIRTHLGRHVRAMCGKHDVPWRLCGSGGRGGQIEAVLTVASAVRRGR